MESPLQWAASLPLGAKIAALVVGVPLLAIVLNVLRQLVLPQDKTKPPVVFHLIPWFGSAAPYGMDPYKFMFDCRDKYGDVFTFILLGRKMTVALGPKGNNLSLGGKVQYVRAEDAYTHLTTPVFGKGVVYDCPNEMLMQQKKFIKHGLTTDSLQSYAELMASEARDFFRDDIKLTDENPGPKKVEALKVMAEMIVLTAARSLQGKEVRANIKGPRFAKYLEDLDKGFTPINFMFPNLPLPSYRRRDAAQKAMSDFYLEIMEKRRAGESDFDDRDMISALQGSVYKDGTPLTDRDVAHMMIALLMAGQHTSSATSSWIILHLAHDQELLKALVQEQVEHFGNPDGTFRDIRYEETKNLPLMDACIRETLRMHAPIHTIMRKVIKDMPVPQSLSAPSESGQYVIPEGHFIVAAPGVSQMDPKIWDGARDFRPYRWLEAGGVAKTANEQYMAGEKQDYGFGAVSKGTESPYQPFGAGRHRCVGEQFAYLQLTIVISEIIRNYELEPIGEFPQTNFQTMIVLPLDGYLNLRKRTSKPLKA